MDEKFSEVMNSRAAVYKLLGRLFRKEADEELVGQLRVLDFSEVPSAKVKDGFKKMKSVVADSSNLLDGLAVDYARVFLGAGIAEGLVAFPFESVYTSKDRLVMQDAYEQVLRIYRSNGVEKIDADLYEDHIGLELEFMGHLCGQAAQLAAQGKETELSANFDLQQSFLVNHLLNWTPDFLKDIQGVPSTDFYKGVALVTEGFLEMEKEFFLNDN